VGPGNSKKQVDNQHGTIDIRATIINFLRLYLKKYPNTFSGVYEKVCRQFENGSTMDLLHLQRTTIETSCNSYFANVNSTTNVKYTFSEGGNIIVISDDAPNAEEIYSLDGSKNNSLVSELCSNVYRNVMTFAYMLSVTELTVDQVDCLEYILINANSSMDDTIFDMHLRPYIYYQLMRKLEYPVVGKEDNYKLLSFDIFITSRHQMFSVRDPLPKSHLHMLYLNLSDVSPNKTDLDIRGKKLLRLPKRYFMDIVNNAICTLNKDDMITKLSTEFKQKVKLPKQMSPSLRSADSAHRNLIKTLKDSVLKKTSGNYFGGMGNLMIQNGGAPLTDAAKKAPTFKKLYETIVATLLRTNKTLAEDASVKIQTAIQNYETAENELFALYNQLERLKNTPKKSVGETTSLADLTAKYDKQASVVAKRENKLTINISRLADDALDFITELGQGKHGSFLDKLSAVAPNGNILEKLETLETNLKPPNSTLVDLTV